VDDRPCASILAEPRTAGARIQYRAMSFSRLNAPETDAPEMNAPERVNENSVGTGLLWHPYTHDKAASRAEAAEVRRPCDDLAAEKRTSRAFAG
jgi:hypothetical protein